VVASEFLPDMVGHPIEPGSDLLLISTRHPDPGAFWDLRLNGRRAVGRIYGEYGSNNVLFVFHVAGSSETEHTRDSVTPPVSSEGTTGKILLEHFQGRPSIYLVDDVSSGGRHYALATDRHIADAESRDWLGLAREQGVRNSIGSDLVIAVLVSLHQREVVTGSPPQIGSSGGPLLALRRIHRSSRGSIREDEQAQGIRTQIGREALGDTLAGSK
jgi:hypothetical protein